MKTITSSVIMIAALLATAGALAQQAPAQGKSLGIGEPEEGVSLWVSGTDVWSQCAVQNEDTGKVRTAKGTCRTIGWGLITNDASPDRVVLCRDCASEDPSENNESILGVVDPWGKPAWGMRHDDWYESGYDAKGVTLVDLTRDGRAELLVVEEFAGGSEAGTALAVLTWSSGTMKQAFIEVLGALAADPEKGWNSVDEESNLIEFVYQDRQAFTIRVTPYKVKKGKPKFGKPREFVWNQDTAMYEETKAGKKKK